jgi:hypothetical protein
MKQIITLALFLAGITFLTIFLILHPSYSSIWDLSKSSAANIGSSIGGLTAPILSIFSSYLLYLALSAQRAANNDQRIKADSDIIFLLISQLEQEYNSFETETTYRKTGENPVTKITKGYEALTRFATLYGSNVHTNLEAFLEDARSDNFLLLLRSFDLITETIESADFTEKTKSIFRRKIQIYYKSKLEFPVVELSKRFQSINHPIANEISNFKLRYTTVVLS